jgi:hypothetical protein
MTIRANLGLSHGKNLLPHQFLVISLYDFLFFWASGLKGISEPPLIYGVIYVRMVLTKRPIAQKQSLGVL